MNIDKVKNSPYLLKTNLIVLVALFFLFLGFFFVPIIGETLNPFFLFLIFTFLFLGGSLTFLSAKANIQPRLRKFLLLTGVSAVGFPLFVVLHNFFYALGVLSLRFLILLQVFEILHVVAFLISLIICPIGFIVGMFGSIYLFFIKREP